MFPLFDNRYLYQANDTFFRSMSIPSQLFKATADFLDEGVLPGNVSEMAGNSETLWFRRAAAARFRLMQRMTQSYQKPAFGITLCKVNNKEVRIEQETAFETAFCKMLHFKKDSNVNQPRLLLVAPMAGHYATLLRDTVRDSLPYFDVYVTDWMNARDVPISHGGFDMDGYIATLVRCFEYLAPDFTFSAYASRGVPAYAAVALLEDNEKLKHLLPHTLTVMGSPIDVRRSPTSVDNYAFNHEEDWFEQISLSVVPPGYPGTGRLVYPGFLQLAAFISMHPERHQKSISDAMRHYEQGNFEGEEKIASFYMEYCSVMDLTAEFYLQTVRVVFKEALLPKGEMVSRGRKIDPGAIRKTALLAVEGEHDDICGIGQTQAALDLATSLPDSMKSYLFIKDAGHYGLFNGHLFRNEVLPALRKLTAETRHKKDS